MFFQGIWCDVSIHSLFTLMMISSVRKKKVSTIIFPSYSFQQRAFGEACALDCIYEDCFEPQPFVGKLVCELYIALMRFCFMATLRSVSIIILNISQCRHSLYTIS